jgi:multidrug resistance efflux pump
VLLTSAAVIVALLVLRQLWVYYMDEPWTRDAHVGADVVQVAPDVSGLVETVHVADNQAVKKGDLLFVVDRARYRIALEQAKANLAERQASVAQLRREIGRDRSLQDLVAAEDAEVRRAKLQAAQAALATAQAAVDLAELNLGRTEVRAGRWPGQRPHPARGRLRGGRQAGAGAAGYRLVPHRWLLRGNPPARRGAGAERGHPPDGRVGPAAWPWRASPPASRTATAATAAPCCRT